MARKIAHSGAAPSRIRDTSPAQPRVEPAAVAAALGGEDTGVTRDQGGGPVSLFLVRAELARRLHSSGGRPALEGSTRRVKIPVGEQEWRQLEELAASLAEGGFTPSAGQVASVLLTLSLRSLVERGPDSVRTELREQGPSRTGPVP
jgi:hypothetical protein